MSIFIKTENKVNEMSKQYSLMMMFDKQEKNEFTIINTVTYVGSVCLF